MQRSSWCIVWPVNVHFYSYKMTVVFLWLPNTTYVKSLNVLSNMCPMSLLDGTHTRTHTDIQHFDTPLTTSLQWWQTGTFFHLDFPHIVITPPLPPMSAGHGPVGTREVSSSHRKDADRHAGDRHRWDLPAVLVPSVEGWCWLWLAHFSQSGSSRPLIM